MTLRNPKRALNLPCSIRIPKLQFPGFLWGHVLPQGPMFSRMMSDLPYILWPGLAALWLRGSRWGLFVAGAFALALNLALISTFVWPQLLGRSLPLWVVPTAAWVLVLWFWVVSARASFRIVAEERARNTPPSQAATELLCQAQTQYLKGNFSQADAILARLLIQSPGDVEARLLAASICRHTARREEATQRLQELSSFPAAAQWQVEIADEHRRLAIQLNGQQRRNKDQTPQASAARAA